MFKWLFKSKEPKQVEEKIPRDSSKFKIKDHGGSKQPDGSYHLWGDYWFFDENGDIHNENGPAIIYADGYKKWYNHGKLIREEYSEPMIRKVLHQKRLYETSKSRIEKLRSR